MRCPAGMLQAASWRRSPHVNTPPSPLRSTLRFACRAKRVVNNATVNEVLSDAAVLKRQAHEIEELRRMLEGTGCALPWLPSCG